MRFACFSVFEGMPIPYPERVFLSDEDNEDKADTAASKVSVASCDKTQAQINPIVITLE